MNKRFVLINIFVIFAFGFLVHGIYSWIPSFITSIFPVNESLYEHLKLIFLSPVIGSTILYFIFRYKGIKINNYAFGLLCSTMFNIILFYLIYLPVYYAYGANLVVILIIYFITICVSQYFNYLIIEMDDNHKLNIVSIISIIVLIILQTYLTWNPADADFFRDPETNTYGIKDEKFMK